jgi:hypothetical protein
MVMAGLWLYDYAVFLSCSMLFAKMNIEWDLVGTFVVTFTLVHFECWPFNSILHSSF